MRLPRPGVLPALLPLLVAVAACEVSSEGPRDRDAAEDTATAEGTRAMMPAGEAESIARTVAAAVEATLATGSAAATGMPAHYTPDAILSDETEQTYAGRAAVARAFAQGMPAGASLDIQSTSAIGSGDLVVDMGTYTFTAPGPQGTPTEMRGRYMVALQRMSDGSWKIVRQVGDAVGIGGALPGAPPPASTPPAPFTTSPAPSGFDTAQ